MMTSVIKNRVLTALGFLGIFVTGELSLALALNTNVPCGIAGGGCEKVAADSWSHIILGIPNAYLGLAAYLVLTAFAAARIYVGVFQEPRSIKLGLLISGVGIAYSAVLLYRMLFVIKGVCPWCLTSDIVLLATFIFYLMLNKDLIEAQKAGQTGERLKSPDTSKLFVPALFVVVFGSLGVAAMNLQPGSTSLPGMTNSDFKILEQPSAHIENPQGKLTLIEFGDVVCPVCRRIYGQVHAVVLGSGGKIRFIFHHFPLVMIAEHKDAFPGAIIAELCGEQGKFFDFLDAVYTMPPGAQNADQPPPMVTLAQMKAIAEGFGVSRALIDQKLQDALSPNDTDPEYQAVLNDMELGQKFHIRGTPTYFVIAPDQPPVEADSTNILKTLAEPQYKAYVGGGSG